MSQAAAKAENHIPKQPVPIIFDRATASSSTPIFSPSGPGGQSGQEGIRRVTSHPGEGIRRGSHSGEGIRRGTSHSGEGIRRGAIAPARVPVVVASSSVARPLSSSLSSPHTPRPARVPVVVASSSVARLYPQSSSVARLLSSPARHLSTSAGCRGVLPGLYSPLSSPLPLPSPTAPLSTSAGCRGVVFPGLYPHLYPHRLSSPPILTRAALSTSAGCRGVVFCCPASILTRAALSTSAGVAASSSCFPASILFSVLIAVLTLVLAAVVVASSSRRRHAVVVASSLPRRRRVVVAASSSSSPPASILTRILTAPVLTSRAGRRLVVVAASLSPRGCCDAPVMHLCAAPRLVVVASAVVVASSLRRRRCVVVVELQGSAPNRNCQPTPRREIVNPIVNPTPAPRRRRVAARGCCDAPVMRLCAAPRCRVVVVAPSSSRRAWQHLAATFGAAWLATFGWQHLAGTIWLATFGAAWLATFGWQHLAACSLVVAASSPRRPILTILLGQSGGGPCEGESLGSCSDWAPGRLRGSGLL